MANTIIISRDQLEKFLPNHETIRSFEQLLKKVSIDTPDSLNEANNNANTAIALATAALSQLAELVSALDQALFQPAVIPMTDDEPLEPNYSNQLGTIAYQNADDIEVTGGTISGISAASFVAITYSGQLASTIATGTAPMVVASTTKVTNLNVDLLDGGDWSTPGAIGTGTPNTGAFTTLTTSGNATFGTSGTTCNLNQNGSASGTGGGATYMVKNTATNVIGIGNKSAFLGTAYDATAYIFHNGELNTHGNMKINGYLSITGNIGFYGSPVAAKPTATGSRGGNAALASLLTGLAGLGLITDSTTA